MKKMMKKLKSQAGETIAEVLIALLISTIALLMLATMINSSANSIQKSRDILESYYNSAWTNETSALDSKLKVEFQKPAESGTTPVTIQTYPDEDVTVSTKMLGGKTVYSYN